MDWDDNYTDNTVMDFESGDNLDKQEHQEDRSVGGHLENDNLATNGRPSPCSTLPLAHHVLECGHRVVVPEMWINQADRISPCSANCASTNNAAVVHDTNSRLDSALSGALTPSAMGAAHTFLCQECYANAFFRRYTRSGDFSTEQALAQCQDVFDAYWGMFEVDGALFIGTRPATKEEKGEGEDEAMANLLGGMTLREQDTAGILEGMGGMSL